MKKKLSQTTAFDAAQTITTTKWGDEAYHDAHEIILMCLIQDLKSWIKDNPPGSSYEAKDPMKAIYQFIDKLHPKFANRAVKDIIWTNIKTLQKTANHNVFRL